MKSRTSFFNATVLKNDLIRFAPVWGLYTLITFFTPIFTSIFSFRGMHLNVTYCIENLLETSATWNCIYALVVALAVFSNSFQFRMAGTLHAMPLRREGWFLTHTVSGLLMTLIPNALISLAMLTQLHTTSAILSLLWFAVNTLEFLFFFGLALLSCQLVGNRVGSAFVYGIANFACLLIFVLVDVLYTPQLNGIELTAQRALYFCPVVHLGQTAIPRVFARLCPILFVNSRLNLDINSFLSYVFDFDGTFKLLGLNAEKWWYLVVCSVIGVGLWAVALCLFRKRRMEAAGDFIAIRSLVPVYLAMHILLCGTFCYVLSYILGEIRPLLFFSIGMVIGFFTGLMLLNKTARIFSWRNLLTFLMSAAILIGSVFLVGADPFGLVNYVPEPEDVASVSIFDESSSNPKIIARVTELQRALIADKGDDSSDTFSIFYHLKSGKTIHRYYHCPDSSETYQQMRFVLSSPELVFETDDFQKFASNIRWIESRFYRSVNMIFAKNGITDFNDGLESSIVLGSQELQELLKAIEQDCAEGHMVQPQTLHPDKDIMFAIELDYVIDGEDDEYYLLIWDEFDSHTIQYLDDIIEKYND